MPKGYWIARITVTDPDKYPDYIAAAKPAFEKFGAVYRVRGGTHEAAEGQARDRNVVIEFDSYETARACYHSPEYQAAAKIRQAASQSELVIVEGTE